jgi:hypothetical protein
MSFPVPRAISFASRSTQFDPILLSVFSNRFMSIAEQMGKTLQVRCCRGLRPL